MTPIRASLLSATSIATALGAAVSPAGANLIYSVNGVFGTLGGSTTIGVGQLFSSTTGFTLVGSSSTALMTIARNASTPSGTTTMLFNAGPIGTATAPFKVDSTASTDLNNLTPTTTRTFTFTPTTTGAQSSTLAVRGTNPNNANSIGYVKNTTDTTTVTVAGTGVAPLASVTSTLSLGTIRAGTSATANLVVQNTGDGNRAGKDNGGSLLTNLRGSVGTGSGMFSRSTASTTFSLTDTTGGQLAANASSTYTFTYAPTARSAADTAKVTTTLNNGATTGNASGTATTTLSGAAVGPDYAADLNKAGASIFSGATIGFGDLAAGVTKNSLLVNNVTTDKDAQPLTNMTVTATIIGDAASEFSFSLSGFQTGGVLRSATNGADIGNIAVQFVSKTGGTATAQLQIRTDEESSLGVMGSSVYVYNLIGTVPEPGTLMVLGTGLLGLAFARRRQRIAALTEADDAQRT